jgi:type IV pilus assembly protein PilQ
MKRIRDAVYNKFWLAALVCMSPVVGANAQDAGNASGPNKIEIISAKNEIGGKVVISVGMKSAPSNMPAAFTINTPPRIVFDFPETENGLGKSTQEFGEGDLKSANIVQAGNRTRLVVNLTQLLSYEMRADGNNLLITLQRRGGGESSGSVAHFAEGNAAKQGHNVQDIDFHRGKSGEGRVQIDLSDPDVGIDIRQQGRLLLVDFQKTGIPKNLQRKLDVSDFGTPVQLIDAFQQGDGTRLVVDPKGTWEYSAYQTDNRFFIEIKAIQEDPNKLIKGNHVGYAGEKLTLNFQNISVREALSVIADFTNLNIVISDTVTGTLTLRLKDVPWDQALDIILQSKGLDMRKNGNVVQVAPREEIAAKEKLDYSARQEITELEPLRTETFQLAYAKAADFVKLFSDEKQKILSKRGSAISDARTNMLFVQDTPSRLEEIRQFIKLIDVPVRQVLIEARFVEAKEAFNHQLGGRLAYTGPDQTAGGGFTVGNGQRGAVTRAGSLNLPGPSSLGAKGGLTLMLFNAAATKTLTLELMAATTDGTSKNIASPRVVTADKTEANIESGVEIPYLQASSSGATNVAFKKAVLSLVVTPQITPENHVSMQLQLKQDKVGQIFYGVPSIDTKKVNTTVLVDNGGTVVIGGIYTQADTDDTTGIVGLKDIPILGWLFKNSVLTKEKKELLVFITPKILQETLGLN